MKTLAELLQQQPVFLNDWKNKTDIVSDFDDIYMSEEEYNAETSPYADIQVWEERKAEMKASKEKWLPINILFASYSTGNYEGDAWVLFEENGELFEVSGSHCSCYGLEGQWDREPVVLEELKNRIEKGSFGNDDYLGNDFAAELKVFLGL